MFFRFLYCTPCDLASFTSIRECANKIKEKEKRIDGLLNNAGVMYAPKSYSEDGIEIHWAVNHLGHYLLTKLLKDQLMGGRVLYMIDMNYRYVLCPIKKIYRLDKINVNSLLSCHSIVCIVMTFIFSYPCAII